MKSFRFVSLALIVSLSACGSGESGIDLPDSSPGERRELPAPLFEFVPGPPGRTVGVRAVVDVDGRTLTTDPLEMTLLEPEQSPTSAPAQHDVIELVPGRSLDLFGGSEWRGDADHAVATYDTLQSCPERGQVPSRIGTVNGAVCYMANTISVGSLSEEIAAVVMYLFAREGLYVVNAGNNNLYMPIDLIRAGWTISTGCIFGDQPGSLTTEYLASLESLSVSFGIGIHSVGYTLYTGPGRGLVRAFQYDTGASISLGFLPGIFSVGMSVQVDALGFNGPRFVRPWREGCPGLAEEPDQNPFEYAREGLLAMQAEEPSSLEDALAREMALGVLPVLDSLGSPGTGGLDTNVPAATNADFFDEFLHQPGTSLRTDAPNTSIDAILEDYRANVAGSDGSTAAVVSISRRNAEQLVHAMPSPLGQTALQGEAAIGMQAGEELADLMAPAMSGRERYLDPRIVHIEVESGEQAELVITAEEIAQLIGRPAADVIGSEIILNSGTRIVDQRFTLSGEELRLTITPSADALLIRVDVDLSTAQGTFPADVADWVVRPAMRAIRVHAGPATRAFITAAPRLTSGAPVTLNVQVVDEAGRLVRRDFHVRFIDAEGNEIAQVDSERGTAAAQYVPRPTEPVVASIEGTTLTYQGNEFPGLVIRGHGFSTDAAVRIGETVLEGVDALSVASPERILVALPEGLVDGVHRVVVVNPRSVVSAPFEVTLPLD